MAIDDYWFKNAVLYCLNVATYMDCNGDGIGDFEGLSPAARLPARARRHLRLAAAVLLLAQPRQRLRRLRLLRREPALRHLGRLRRVHEPRAGARHARRGRPRREPHLRSTTPGSSRRAPIRSRLTATGTCGATSARAATPQARCSRRCRRPPGRATRKPASTTSTASTSTRRISTPTTRPTARSSTRSWATGCSSACRASAWTRCPSWWSARART